MKWFKHMTASYDDEKIAAMLDELGMEGYGFWWRILEIVAAKLDEKNETFCSYSSKKWGEFFGFSAKKFEKFVRIFEKNEIFSVNFSENKVTVDIPNILKYKDEYSSRLDKKSGQNRDNVQNGQKEKERTKEKEIKRERKINDANASFSPEPENLAHGPVAENALESIPLVDGSEFPITDTHVAEFERAYPAVDVVAELHKMRAWCISNPSQKKTRKGVMRFVNSWLEREQNRGGDRKHSASTVPKATTVAQQRSLERQMMAQMVLDDRKQQKEKEAYDAHGSRIVTQPDGSQLTLPPGW